MVTAHPDEDDLLRAQLNSGLPLARISRSRLKLALGYRKRLLYADGQAFESMCKNYAVATMMVDRLRKESPLREDLLLEYETLCLNIQADAVAMMRGYTSDRWF